MTTQENNLEKLTQRVIAHAMLVLLIGLIAGILLIFSLLDAVTLWPLPAWQVDIPGSTRGWQAAHVGGILNGVMIACLALLMRYLDMAGKRAFWTAWGLLITGWANTIFYWAGNFSSNRGLSVSETPFGPGDLMGAIAYIGGGSGMAFTIVAVSFIGLSAFDKSVSSEDK
ncbi:MAG: hypothetical protein H8D52_01345 [Gammaproteobacteria bacterium]|nr:hypothetical protein [Gammaproteobacteria bacterium]